MQVIQPCREETLIHKARSGKKNYEQLIHKQKSSQPMKNKHLNRFYQGGKPLINLINAKMQNN